MEGMKLGSLFSGSGGFELAGLLTGRITPVWASEIEPFPVLVTHRRMPWLRHYGSITEMHGDEVEPVDIITGGSPCQDLSVAGLRAGLGGERSGLFTEMIRMIKEMQGATDGRYPRYIVWENVPGAFSSNGGRDFRTVLESFAGLFGKADIPMPDSGKWATAGYILGDDHGSLAWRVLDAQYWGVPQRRRRVFLVCDTHGAGAPEILFESEGVFRDFREGTKARQGAPRCPGGSAYPAGGGRDGSLSKAPDVLCLNDQGGCVMGVTEGFTGTLRHGMSHHQPLVLQPWVIRLRGEKDTAETVYSLSHNDMMTKPSEDIAATLLASSHKEVTAVTQKNAIRRLTPTECARLQGFPDGWAHNLAVREEDITEDEMAFWREAFSWSGRRKTDSQIRKWLAGPYPDSAEYKMWGNGVALPCVAYVMLGIASQAHEDCL